MDLSAGITLPVHLVTFNATKHDQQVLLNWQTANELNSKLFEIERSADGNQFRSIGTVYARGNSNSVAAYSFTDGHPLKGKNYYRLRQVDLDERFEYSMVRSVVFDPDKILSVFPNPVADVLHLEFGQLFKQARVEVISADGKVMMTAGVKESWTYDLPVGSLAGGMYTVRLIAGGYKTSVLVVKK